MKKELFEDIKQNFEFEVYDRICVSIKRQNIINLRKAMEERNISCSRSKLINQLIEEFIKKK